jgi:hypothetical protein
VAIPARVQLVPVAPTILSSYGGPDRARLKPVRSIACGFATPDTAAALLELDRQVTEAGGDFRVTDLFRPYDVQAGARARYDRWVAAGKPARGSSEFDAKNMKADFVAPPGHSNHEAGRAADLNTAAMKFPGVAADKQLDRLWEIAIPIGWKPIIKQATEGATENWHFDFLGEWRPVADRLRDYGAVAMIGCLDIGLARYGNDEERAIQANLHRAGYDVGRVDGIIGRRTEGALVACGLGASCRDLSQLFALPSSPTTIWS